MSFGPLKPDTPSVSFDPSVPSCVFISSSMENKVDPVSYTASVPTMLAPLASRTATTWSKALHALAVKTGFVKIFQIDLSNESSCLYEAVGCAFPCNHLCHKFFPTSSDSLEVLHSNSRDRI